MTACGVRGRWAAAPATRHWPTRRRAPPPAAPPAPAAPGTAPTAGSRCDPPRWPPRPAAPPHPATAQQEGRSCEINWPISMPPWMCHATLKPSEPRAALPPAPPPARPSRPARRCTHLQVNPQHGQLLGHRLRCRCQACRRGRALAQAAQQRGVQQLAQRGDGGGGDPVVGPGSAAGACQQLLQLRQQGDVALLICAPGRRQAGGRWTTGGKGWGG